MSIGKIVGVLLIFFKASKLGVKVAFDNYKNKDFILWQA
jgi:hypothetical protein